MASAGTFLSDLDEQDNNVSGNDGDLVQKILADMNVPTQQQMPRTMQGGGSASRIDSQIPTSHMIGNEHPSPAEFASSMGGSQMQQQQQQMQMPQMHPMQMQQQQMHQQQQQQQQQMQQPMQFNYQNNDSKNFYGRFLEEAKVPFVVAMLFFAFSLPPIRILVAHYLPTLIKPTGDFQMTGLVLVSGIVGAMFWILQRVIAPLLSL